MFRGVTTSGDIIEIWVNPERGSTWYILHVQASAERKACFRVSGSGFSLLDFVPQEGLSAGG